MFEAIDVVIAGVFSPAIGMISYSSIKKARNSTGADLIDKQKRRQQRLAQRELWEHAAYATALGITMFLFSVFNAATNMSHYPVWPRLIVKLVCLLAVLYILRSTTHPLFQYFRNKSAKIT